MIIERRQWRHATGWNLPPARIGTFTPQLVIFFGAPEALAVPGVIDRLHTDYPEADIVGCSTAGEILGVEVTDGSVVAAAIQFEQSRVRVAHRELQDVDDSSQAGRNLADDVAAEDLSHLIVLAEGIHVNGSELVAGLREHLPGRVAVTGGLAGDGDRFISTTVYCNQTIGPRAVVAIGLYGDRLTVGYGSRGGWDTFGPDRLITRSRGNILYELDGRPALELYKRYLGPHANDLPASGLLFPLSLRGQAGQPRVVRTILGIDEAAGALIFAGDVPQGEYGQLMRANVDRLVDGAHDAGLASRQPGESGGDSLALLVSCVGRKLVLNQRIEEELEAVQDALGPDTTLCGFYSYGEIAPFGTSTKCELHNQTMTVTTLRER